MTMQATDCPVTLPPGSPTARRLWRTALLLSLTALMSAVLLTGTSVWFLGAVAIAGAGPAAFTFNFHIPAALVRMFALSRTAAKYGERIYGHRAALVDQVARRSRLLLSMATAPAVRRAGWQLARQDRLNDYIDDVEDVDYARLRVALPATGLAIGFAVLTAVTLAVVPLAMVPVSALAVAAAAIFRDRLPLLRYDWQATRKLERGASARFGTIFSAIVPLKAEGAWADGLHDAFQRLERAEDRQRRFRIRLAAVETFPQLAGPFSALSVLVCAWLAGMSGSALLPAAFIAFAWLALGEGAAGLSRVAAGRVRREAAEAGLAEWRSEGGAMPAAEVFAQDAQELAVEELRRTAPDGRPLGGIVSLACRKGRACVLIGPSGSGKTTLLKQIAGWLPPGGEGRILIDGAEVDRQAMCHLGLHDAAVLDDTVRENLFAADRDDAACRESLEAVELAGRIEEAGGLDAWITQDRLSLGEAQRLNLARAWLSAAPVVLLDEPTEHVDGAQAERIMRRLAGKFADRIFICSTHRQETFGRDADIDVISLR